jgi:hypothetical protein
VGIGGWNADIPERDTGLGNPFITVHTGLSPIGIGWPSPKDLGGSRRMTGVSGLGGSEFVSVSGTLDTRLAIPLRSCFLIGRKESVTNVSKVYINPNKHKWTATLLRVFYRLLQIIQLYLTGLFRVRTVERKIPDSHCSRFPWWVEALEQISYE